MKANDIGKIYGHLMDLTGALLDALPHAVNVNAQPEFYDLGGAEAEEGDTRFAVRHDFNRLLADVQRFSTRVSDLLYRNRAIPESLGEQAVATLIMTSEALSQCDVCAEVETGLDEEAEAMLEERRKNRYQCVKYMLLTDSDAK